MQNLGSHGAEVEKSWHGIDVTYNTGFTYRLLTSIPPALHYIAEMTIAAGTSRYNDDDEGTLRHA